MLDLLRENQAAPQAAWGACGGMVFEACGYLKILDPVHGDKELVTAVAVENAKLSGWLSSVAQQFGYRPPPNPIG